MTRKTLAPPDPDAPLGPNPQTGQHLTQIPKGLQARPGKCCPGQVPWGVMSTPRTGSSPRTAPPGQLPTTCQHPLGDAAPLPFYQGADISEMEMGLPKGSA